MRRLLLPLLIIIILSACKKEDLEDQYQSATLHFSNDTITFDTVFTGVGSITKTLIVYNHNNFDVNSDIAIAGNSGAYFRMNIDGEPGNQNNVHIPAKDSIWIFLEVSTTETSSNNPYIFTDSLVFKTGAKQQDIDLVAWGQDAYFHTPNSYGQIIDGNDTINFPYHQIDCSQAWENDKPHVIYGYAIVDPLNTLTINEGCDIYLHKNSGIIIGNPFTQTTGGTIKINGTLGNEVTFQGDRLDAWYTQSPRPAGQWDRIWITPGSINNEINYAIIKNGNIGIHADTTYNSNPTVEINNTIIDNMSGVGILGQGANINASNTVISKCGQYTLACNIGGTYNFTHCTFANYWDDSNRNTPSILLTNYYEGSDGSIYPRALDAANFTNCIIYGNMGEIGEISFNKLNGTTFNYSFDHCIIKLDPTLNTDNPQYINSIINQDPKFIDIYKGDFHLEENSPAIDNGNNSTEGTLDIEEKNRENPDIGAFEYQ